MGHDVRKAILIISLLGASYSACARSSALNVVPVAQLGSVLNCLQSKLLSIGAAPPKVDRGHYKVRYRYGVVTKGYDQPDELQLLVYAPHDSANILYRVYFDSTPSWRPEIYIGDWASIEVRHGQFVPKLIPGGKLLMLIYGGC